MQKNILLPIGFVATLGLSLVASAQQPPVAAPTAPNDGAVSQSQSPVAPSTPTTAPVAPAPAAVEAPEAPEATVPGTTTAPAATTAPATTTAPAAATAPATTTAPAAATAPAATTAPAAPSGQTATSPAWPSAEGVTPSAPAAETNVAPAEAGAVPAEAQAAAPALPAAHDLTPLGMYQQADWVVKSVMIILALACFLTWTIWLFKTIEIFIARGRARAAARSLIQASSLHGAVDSLGKRRDPGAFMAKAVLEEYRRSTDVIDPAGAEGTKERAVSLVNRVEVQAAARLRRGMGLLATVGSVSPFVGLFGTVWGIMNSFIGIAETQTTNLAVVAPGIAEALFATAIGLVAAIPAVVIYNHFTRGIAGYRQALGDAGAATLRLLSRDIDFRHVKGA